MEITFKPIGINRTPFKNFEEMPIQPTSNTSGSGVIEVFPEFKQSQEVCIGWLEQTRSIGTQEAYYQGIIALYKPADRRDEWIP